MIKKLLFIISFFSVFSTIAQDKTIELPDVDMRIGMKDMYPFSLFVTENHNIIYKKDTVSIYQIKELLYDFTFSTFHYNIQTHLFVDKNVRYSLLDSIKTEISSTNASKYIVYRSNNLRTGRIRNKVKGIKHKSPLSYYSYMPPEYLQTKKEIKEKDSLLKERYKLNPNLPPVPNPNDSNWIPYISIETAIYNRRQNVIDEALQNKTYKCYSISNNGLIDGKGEEVAINKEILQNILYKNDVVFIKYETDLIYNNYIKFITILQELKPNFKQNKAYAEVIELSYQIQDLHKKERIKLCN